MRDIFDALVAVGLEKNGDDTLQQLLSEGSKIGLAAAAEQTKLHVEDETGRRAELGNATLAIPSQRELVNDAAELISSLKQLSWLFLASTAFRVLISDILLIAQELTAATAVEVETLASQVTAGATEVEALARGTVISVDGMKEQLREAGHDIARIGAEQGDRLNALQLETSNKISDSLITRIQQVLVSAHENPPERKALLTILLLARNYADRISASVVNLPKPSDGSSTPAVHPELHLDSAVTHFLSLCQTLLERFASGHSLHAVRRLLYQATVDIINIPAGAETDIKSFFRDLGAWIDRSLDAPSYATSRSGTAALERLLARGEVIFGADSNTQLAQDCRALAHELQLFAQKLTTDSSTTRLLNAVDGLLSNAASFGRSAAASAASEPRRWRGEIQRDIIVWWLPRLLAAIKNVPLPRVEYKDSSVDVALDSLLLTSTSATASLLPDHVCVQNWSELRIDTEADGQRLPAREARVQMVDRVHIHLDGMRFAAEGFGYFLRYKGWPGYQDQGLLSVSAGHGDKPLEGLQADVTLTIVLPNGASSPNLGADASLFRVDDVVIDIPGLRFTFEKSKHWILNALLIQPVSGPIVRAIIRRILQAQIRALLDNLGESLARVSLVAEAEAVRQGESVSMGHYWYALLQTDAPCIDREPEPQAASTTALSLTGAARTTWVLPEGEDGPPQTPVESTLAVGIGPQVISEDAGPYEEGGPSAALHAAVTDIAERIGGMGRQAANTAQDATDRIVTAREESAEAQKHKVARERLEHRRPGWRSDAFDL
ncbi:hypothetical protein FA95DRAFT_1557314 [Auriscalpium vulgare]|uniref:Uncharacterized protein n=1 Tax=Auriscalpium vulgare TaxID=40419 RepID=A0ACB8RY61_9AGAM|nr:hypothetical protein FA95DRAFT_1557314 [Auriscalpium vulgare]